MVDSSICNGRHTQENSLGDREKENSPTHDQAPRHRSNQARGRDPAGNLQRREQPTLLQSLIFLVFRRPSFLVSTLVGERKVFALLPLRRHSQDSVGKPACRTEGETFKRFLCQSRPKGSRRGNTLTLQARPRHFLEGKRRNTNSVSRVV